MRVWFPLISAGSGADVFVERLADGLRARGVEALISRFPNWYELAPDLLRRVPPPSGTNIIHANTSYAHAFARPGARLVATELHYLLDPDYRPFKSQAQNIYHRLVVGPNLCRSYAAADAVTAISQFTASVLARVAKVNVAGAIPLWVDMQQFVPARADPGERGGRPFRLMFVGNDTRRKGADVLPELAGRLGPGFEILCTSGLRQRMQTHNVSNVRVLGRLTTEALVREYQDCDAVLVPSRYEGFGYAALEAMACAKPVVGFRCGAIAEVVEDRRTALLADVDDIDGLVSHCRQLASNSELCRELGKAGRLRAERTYSETTSVGAYMDLYEKLLSSA